MKIEDLRKPMPEKDLEWRTVRTGNGNRGPWAIVAPYIKSRAIMQRLDEVCGPENWQLTTTPYSTGVIASIGIRIDGEWVWKSDGAGFTDVESFKGGVSDAIKRAGVPWGIGRYLYDLPAPMYAKFTESGKYSVKIDGTWYRWDPPAISSQTHQNGSESTRAVSQESIIIKLKSAADEGLYSEEEFVKLMDQLRKLTNPSALERFNEKLSEGIRKRKQEAA